MCCKEEIDTKQLFADLQKASTEENDSPLTAIYLIQALQQEVGDLKKSRRVMNCDQVAWMLDIFGRYLPKDDFPRVSQQREMKKYGMLYEVMEILNLEFEDARAQWNGTPNTARYNATTREK